VTSTPSTAVSPTASLRRYLGRHRHHPRRLYTADSYNSLTTDGPVPAHTIIDITDIYETKEESHRRARFAALR
jgi:hypothetical protein